MKNSSPLLEEWKALYQAAVEFKKIESWDWMYDSDLFGVQNPETGETGYCCVLGNLGEMFALAVYLGTAGLEGYQKIQSGELWPPDIAVLQFQKCLMADFENRNGLAKQDLEVIKATGLKFRGRNAWPMFRSYRPGYYPWFLNGGEARFLRLALQQAVDVALRFKDDRDLLTSPRQNLFLVRVADKSAAGLHWKDQWLAPEPLQRERAIPLSIDEVRIRKIKRTIFARQGVWETDVIFSPSPVKDKGDERPWYPYFCLWADRQSMFILKSDLVRASDYPASLQEQLFELIEAARFLPAEICVGNKEAVDILEPATSRLGIKLSQSKKLRAIEAARKSMLGFLGSL